MNCNICGRMIPKNTATCPVCGVEVTPPAMPKRENILTGIVGALLGAAIGGAVILLLGRLGFIASISGFILAVCTLKGYELLGRQLSAKGAIICIVLIAVTPYIVDRLDWAFVIQESITDMDITLADAFMAVPDLIEADIIAKTDYLKNLGMLYLFALFGAFSTLRDLFK